MAVAIGLAGCLGAAAPGLATGRRIVRVTQGHVDDKFLLLVAQAHSRNPKKSVAYAQTFRAPKRGLELVSVAPWATFYRGKVGYLQVYRVGAKAPFGRLLATARLPVSHRDRGSFLPAKLSPAIRMRPRTRYAFRITAGDRRSEIALGSGYHDPYRQGAGYVFAWWGGEGSRHRWGRLGGDSDLAFRLTFRRVRAQGKSG